VVHEANIEEEEDEEDEELYNFNPDSQEEAFALPSSRDTNKSFKPGDENNREI